MSDTEQKHFPWEEGIPTRPDVDALLKAWPPDTINPGAWNVTDAEVKTHIGNPESVRYRTVYSAWINRLLHDHSVIVYRSREIGFYCPTAAEVYSRTHPTIESAGRKIGRQLKGVSRSKPTNAIEIATKDHQGKLLYVQKRELRKARMNLLAPSAAPEMPKISPPDAKKKAGGE